MIKVGDLIYVTSGTSSARDHGWIGTLKQVVAISPVGYKLICTDGKFNFYVDGVPNTPLLKELC